MPFLRRRYKILYASLDDEFRRGLPRVRAGVWRPATHAAACAESGVLQGHGRMAHDADEVARTYIRIGFPTDGEADRDPEKLPSESKDQRRILPQRDECEPYPAQKRQAQRLCVCVWIMPIIFFLENILGDHSRAERSSRAEQWNPPVSEWIFSWLTSSLSLHLLLLAILGAR